MDIKGKKVIDAKTPLVLKISATDVKKGRTKEPDACAAAVAAMRQCEGAISAHVHLSRTYIEYPDKVVRYITPQALRTEIISFDRGHQFEAGEYTLPRIYPSASRIGRRTGGPTEGKGRKTGYRSRHYKHLVGVRAGAPKKAHWNRD